MVSAVEPSEIRPRLRDVTEETARPLPASGIVAAPAAATTQVLPPSSFRSGHPDEALPDSLGYGLYARAAEDGREPARVPGEPATLDMIARYRAQATAELHAYAFRYLHNHAEQIRQDAIREQLGRMRRPPGFLKLVTATVAGVLLAGAVMQAALPWIEAHGGVVAAAEALAGRLRAAGG
jgi:hypothetical protein